MKKYMQGFVPINFNKAGKILFTVGLIILMAKLVSFMTDWFNAPNYLFYFSVVLIFLSLYLIYMISEK